MFSTGRSEGDRDEGSKQLIERRDNVDIEQSVCVHAIMMNVSNKNMSVRSRTHMILRGRGGFYYCE